MQKSGSRKTVVLDDGDRRLLRQVQADSSLSADELGERCGMSASTVLRRLKRLRSSGVIKQEVAILDHRDVGRPLLLIIGLRLERDDAAVVSTFLERVRADPAVMQCYFVTGSSDYILHVSARDMDEYHDFVRQLVENPHVAMSETHVVINPVKMTLAVPIDD